MKIKRNIAVCFLLLAFTSCGEYESLAIEKAANKTADSLFRAHKDSFLVMINNECSQNYEEKFKQVFDSLMVEEGEKIKALIEK